MVRFLVTVPNIFRSKKYWYLFAVLLVVLTIINLPGPVKADYNYIAIYPYGSTDKQKLEHLVTIAKEMRDHRNALYQGIKELNLENSYQWYRFAVRPVKYGGNTYYDRLIPVLKEISKLKDKIKSNYEIENMTPDKDGVYHWDQYSDQEIIDIEYQLFGNKNDIYAKNIVVNSPYLTEFKSIELLDLDGIIPPDPLEDFEEFTEIDITDNLTISSNIVDFDITENATCILHKTYPAGMFDNYEHLLRAEFNRGVGWQLYQLPIMTYADSVAPVPPEDYYGLEVNWGGGYKNICVYNRYDFSTERDYSIELTDGQEYYLTITKDHDDFYLDIDTGGYGSVNIDTVYIELQENYSYEVLHIFHRQNESGTDSVTGYIKNVDLQDGGEWLLPPDDFAVIDNGATSGTANWTMPEAAQNVMVRIKRGELPADQADGELVYFGNGESANYSGMSLLTTEYFWVVWAEYDGVYSSTYNYDSIGGGTVDIIINWSDIPLVYFGIAFSLVLILINVISKSPSPILYLGASVLLVGVYFEPEIFDTYYQAGAAIVILFCWIMAFFHWRAKRNYG